MPFIKTDVDGKQIRNRVILDCQKAVEDGEIIRVEQHHKKEVDINTIVQRHAGNEDLIASTQYLQNLTFDDNPLNNFQEAMNMLIQGRQAFEQMPSKIRNEFGNDASLFLDFVRNPDNSAN